MADQAPTMNMGEVAGMLGCSLPTLRQRLKSEPDFPVQQKGDKGVPWVFDPVAVAEYERQQLTARRKEDEARAEALNAFQPGMFEDGSEGPKALSPQTEWAALRVVREKRKLAQEDGLLVMAPGVTALVAEMLTDLGQALDQAPADVVRTFNLPATIEPHLKAWFDEWRIKQFKSLEKKFRDRPGPEQKAMFG